MVKINKTQALIVFGLACVFVILFSFSPTNINTKLSSSLIAPKTTTEYQLALVLGAGLKSDGELSDLSKERVDYSLELYKENPKPILFSGGPTSYGIESEEMYKYAKSNGYDDVELVEIYSSSTYENARYSNELLDNYKTDFSNILVITSPYHTRRSLKMFSSTMDNKIIGIDYPQTSVIYNDSVLGRWKGLKNITREYLANIWYSFRFHNLLDGVE